MLILATLGGMALWQKRRGFELTLLTFPVLLALGASIIRHWPFGANQCMVFAAAVALVLTAEGLETLRQRLTLRQPALGWTLVVLLFLPGIGDAIYRIGSPQLWHDVRPVVAFVQRHLEPGDHVVAQDPATVESYAPEFVSSSAEPLETARVWFIYSGSARQGSPIHDLAGRVGARRPRLGAIERYSAGAILFGREMTVGLHPGAWAVGRERPLDGAWLLLWGPSFVALDPHGRQSTRCNIRRTVLHRARAGVLADGPPASPDHSCWRTCSPA